MINTIPNIIVTGGCGFIGSHLVERLLHEGFFVTVIDDKRAGDFIIQHPHVRYFIHDVSRFSPFTHHIPPPNAIFHLANSPRVRRSIDYPGDTISNNISTTAAVCDWARIFNCRLYFATSSSTKYKESTNPYTWSKKACEDLVDMFEQQYGIFCTKLFFYNVYGPREANYGEYSTVIRKFKTDYLEGRPLTVYGSGKKERDFTHVYDVIQGLLQLLVDERKHSEVHLGKGLPQSIMSIAEGFNTDVIHAFDKPGEAQVTMCEKPYINCPSDVHEYIADWLKRNHNGIS